MTTPGRMCVFCAAVIASVVLQTHQITLTQAYVWSSWSEWSTCNATCVGTSDLTPSGIQLRMRECLHVYNNNKSIHSVTARHCDVNGDHDSKFQVETNNCEIFCPVDGQWGEWSSWSGCNTTTGATNSARERYCDNPAPSHGGLPCDGDMTEQATCIDGGWSSWTSYSKCDAVCGNGFKRSTRTCTEPAPANGGAQCPGDDVQSTECYNGDCPNDLTVCNGAALVTDKVADEATCINRTASTILSNYCSPPDSSRWKLRIKITESTCDLIPHYSPIAVDYPSSAGTMSLFAVLVECYKELATIAVMGCDGSILLEEVKISTTPANYYMVSW